MPLCLQVRRWFVVRGVRSVAPHPTTCRGPGPAAKTAARALRVRSEARRAGRGADAPAQRADRIGDVEPARLGAGPALGRDRVAAAGLPRGIGRRHRGVGRRGVLLSPCAQYAAAVSPLLLPWSPHRRERGPCPSWSGWGQASPRHCSTLKARAPIKSHSALRQHRVALRQRTGQAFQEPTNTLGVFYEAAS